jgi:predicted nucleotidyltransferase
MPASASDWGQVVRTIRRAVGTAPIILAGSRATGSWDDASDVDLVVVLPLARIPRDLKRLARAQSELGEMLDAPVSLNPMPIHQARRCASNLFVWKLHMEGTLLSAPRGFSLECPTEFRVTPTSAYSYLMTAAFRLLDASGAPDPIASWPRDVVSRGVKKALLHVAQLRLLRHGSYESTLDKALDTLQDEELAHLVSESQDPRSWFAARTLLLGELRGVRPSTGLARALVRNAQYAALSRLRGHVRWPAMARLAPFECELGRTALLLMSAVDEDGGVRPEALVNVAAHLPPWVRLPRRDWRRLREALREEWASAHPLMGL